MTNTELLQQGFQLMMVGMGFVMVFLLILIYAISLMSKFIQRFFLETSPISTQSVSQPIKLDNDVEILRPVIAAAIHHHRRQQGLK